MVDAMTRMNEIARLRLRDLERGKSLPLVKATFPFCRSCMAEYPRRLKRCPKCKAKLTKFRSACRLCSAAVPKSRRSWCSQQCKDWYYLATSSSFLRFKVHQRDKGLCAKCDLDCDDLERRCYGYATTDRLPVPRSSIRKTYEEMKMICDKLKAEFGFVGISPRNRVSLWAADHIVPLFDGGSIELSNVQTLCLPCHKEKTGSESTMRAKRKRLIGKRQSETMRRLR